jgi:hypothetical protein
LCNTHNLLNKEEETESVSLFTFIFSAKSLKSSPDVKIVKAIYPSGMSVNTLMINGLVARQEYWTFELAVTQWDGQICLERNGKTIT